MTMPGFGTDVKAGQAKARQLLKEAGYPNLKVTIWNRAVDQPYTIVGTWFIDEWRKVGIKADQKSMQSGPWYAGLRQTRDFDVCIDINSQTVINPPIDVSKWIKGAGNDYTNHQDDKTTELYLAMLNEPDETKQAEKMRAYRGTRPQGPGALHSRLLVVQDHAAPDLHEGLERGAEPLSQPAARHGLDRSEIIVTPPSRPLRPRSPHRERGYSCADAARASVRDTAASGRKIVTDVPTPTSLSIVSVPPCIWIRDSVMARPSPVPSCAR